MSEIEVKVVKVLNDTDILIDRKIQGCNIIRIANIDELLRDIDSFEGK